MQLVVGEWYLCFSWGLQWMELGIFENEVEWVGGGGHKGWYLRTIRDVNRSRFVWIVTRMKSAQTPPKKSPKDAFNRPKRHTEHTFTPREKLNEKQINAEIKKFAVIFYAKMDRRSAPNSNGDRTRWSTPTSWKNSKSNEFIHSFVITNYELSRSNYESFTNLLLLIHYSLNNHKNRRWMSINSHDRNKHHLEKHTVFLIDTSEKESKSRLKKKANKNNTK